MKDNDLKCCDCEMFINGWCCEFGIERSYDAKMPLQCVPVEEDLI
jgi:hypothetical protein